MSHEKKWSNFKNLLLNEGSQSKKTYFITLWRRKNIRDSKKISGYQQLGGEGGITG